MEAGMIPREESAWHAGDVRGPARNLCSLRAVLITKCCTRIQVESCVSEPRSPRPGGSYARLQRRSRMKRLPILWSQPFVQEFLLRGVAPKSREFTSNK